jgi:hypothetical protein
MLCRKSLKPETKVDWVVVGFTGVRIKGVYVLTLNLQHMSAGQENASVRLLGAFRASYSESLDDNVCGRPLGRRSWLGYSEKHLGF